MMRRFMIASAFALLAACGQTPPGAQPSADAGALDPAQATQGGAPDTDPETDAPLPTDGWVGKWVGVEGLALDVARGATPGTYKLTVVLMDGSNTYDGTADGERIKFQRGGATEYVRKAIGAETGLKWLAEKTDCLMIKEGEGFCRG